MITTNNKTLSKKIKLLRSHGIIKKNHWDFNVKAPGLNYRLSDINCSLAYSQFLKLNLSRTLLGKILYDFDISLMI